MSEDVNVSGLFIAYTMAFYIYNKKMDEEGIGYAFLRKYAVLCIKGQQLGLCAIKK